MHLITPHNPWAPKKPRTWQEEAWEQQQVAEIEARMLAEASSKTLPQNAPETSLATAGPAANAAAGGGGIPKPQWFAPGLTLGNISGGLATSMSGSTGSAPYTVYFTNASPPSTIAFCDWYWTAVGPNYTLTSTDINPTLVLDTGSWAISLTGSNKSNPAQTFTSFITNVSSSMTTVTAEFGGWNLANGLNLPFTSSAPASVQFGVLYTGANVNYAWQVANTCQYTWSFGSGSIQQMWAGALWNTSTRFTASYTATGSYTVTLQVTGSPYGSPTTAYKRWNCIRLT